MIPASLKDAKKMLKVVDILQKSCIIMCESTHPDDVIDSQYKLSFS